MSERRDHEEAARMAGEAGKLLLEIREQFARDRRDPSGLRDEGDRRSHDLLMGLLGASFPGDAVLSEEGKDDTSRLRAARTWIVDPLDGTREYSEGRTDWAVHVALVEGGAVTAAAVALPARDLVLTTASPPPLPAAPGPSPRLVVSRTRPPAVTEPVRAALSGELVEMGSAGAKTMAILLGEADVYVHAGGQYEWDSAAPVGVAAAAGLHVSRIDGSPLVYNQENPWMPDLVVCHPSIAARVIEAANA